MPQRSSPSVKVTYFNSDRVWRALRRFVAALVRQRPEIRRVVLFGSLARGDAVPGSDVDLMLVLSTADRRFLDRIPLYTPDRFPVGIEVFPYTGDEIEAMLRDGNPFIRRALEEGITLFDSEKAA